MLGKPLYQWPWSLFGNTSPSRTTVAAAESTSFTSMGSLVRVQLSPPQRSPCKSRAVIFLSPGTTAEGFAFFRVHFGDVNGSSRHFVHTVVWLSCLKIGVARLVEIKLIFGFFRRISLYLYFRRKTLGARFTQGFLFRRRSPELFPDPVEIVERGVIPDPVF